MALGTRLIVGPWMHVDAVRFPDGSTGEPSTAGEPRSEHSVVRSSPAGNKPIVMMTSAFAPNKLPRQQR